MECYATYLPATVDYTNEQRNALEFNLILIIHKIFDLTLKTVISIKMLNFTSTLHLFYTWITN